MHPTRPKAEGRGWVGCICIFLAFYLYSFIGYYKLLLLMVTMSSRLVTTGYYWCRLPCILTPSGIPKTEATNWRQVVKSAACTYKLSKNPFNGTPGYYRLLLLVVTTCIWCYRLHSILTPSCIPKSEATNWRLVFKSTAHISSGKIH